MLGLIVLAGSVVGMATAGLTAWLLGAPLPVVMSSCPKSVTTPIAIEVCRELGIPSDHVLPLVILARGAWRRPGHRRRDGHRLSPWRGHGQPGAPVGDAGHGIVLGHGGGGSIYVSFLAALLALFCASSVDLENVYFGQFVHFVYFR